MKQRIIASTLVFGVGFAIGLTLTWALLAGKPAEATTELADSHEAEAPALAASPQETESADEDVAAGAPTAASKAGDQPGLAAVEVDEPAAPAPLREPTPPAAESPEKLPKADAPGAHGEARPQDAAARPAADDAPALEEPGVDPGQAVSRRSNAWWKGLEGVRCRVDLGRTKALTVRGGDLVDGEKLDWSRRFGTNPRVGMLYSAEENIVTVHGVATNGTGTPVAARITAGKNGKKITGIIALHAQGLKVTLYPVDAAKNTP